MKYIASFDIPEYKNEKRSISLAGINVMEYMTEVYKTVNPIEIISPTRTLNQEGKYRGRNITIAHDVTLRLPSTKGRKGKLGRIISLIWTQLWLLSILLFECKKNEEVIVYHSAAFMPVIKLAKKIRKFKLILEVREIYADANPNINKDKEMSYFDLGDKFIFATELLNQKINKQKKPYIIAPGIYRKYWSDTKKFQDNKIHLVYAGNFNKTKGGAQISISLAEYLSPDYVIHILGAGNDESIDEIQKAICYQNNKGGAEVRFEGELRGSDFITFLQKCDIGLSTQTIEGEFNDTSFPSKILTYLSAGLEVISANIPAVVTSPVGKYVHYYTSNKPGDIASQIQNIRTTLNSDDILSLLNHQLLSDFKKMQYQTN